MPETITTSGPGSEVVEQGLLLNIRMQSWLGVCYVGRAEVVWADIPIAVITTRTCSVVAAFSSAIALADTVIIVLSTVRRNIAD